MRCDNRNTWFGTSFIGLHSEPNQRTIVSQRRPPNMPKANDRSLFPEGDPLDEWMCEYVDGTMDATTRVAFDEYLDRNPELRRQVARMRDMRFILGSSACPHDVINAVGQRIQRSIEEVKLCDACPMATDTIEKSLNKITVAVSCAAICFLTVLLLVPRPSEAVSERSISGLTSTIARQRTSLSASSFQPRALRAAYHPPSREVRGELADATVWTAASSLAPEQYIKRATTLD